MKIATYNLRLGGRGRVHWNEILEEQRPEILLVQESFAPQEHLAPMHHGARHEHAAWSPVETNEKALAWGSAVFLESCIPSAIHLPSFAGWVVGAEVGDFRCPDGRQRKLRAFSVHAPTGMGSYEKVVNYILDALLEYRDGSDIIIGGDFNLTVSERHRTENRETTTAERKIQDRLRDEFGLANCWQTANPGVELAQTLRWSNDRTVPFHCDGLFVPESWAPHLRTCEVLAGNKWDRLSDHNPVVADFETVGGAGG